MSEITRAEYDDAAAAIRTLSDRLAKVEEGLSVAVGTIVTLVGLVDKLDPAAMDRELRSLRLVTQEAEAGRIESKLTKENRRQIQILEVALQRRGPPKEK